MVQHQETTHKKLQMQQSRKEQHAVQIWTTYTCVPLQRILLGRNTWHGTAQGLFASPPPIGGTARHGTKQGGTWRFRPPPPSLCLLHEGLVNGMVWG